MDDNKEFISKSQLGKILKYGDSVMCYDLTTMNILDQYG